MAQVFKKLYPSNPVNLSTGRAIRFEDFGNNVGYFVTDDPAIIGEFQVCMREGRGGVSTATQAEYDEAVKKKPTSRGLNPNSFRELQTSGLLDPSTLRADKAGASPVVVAASALPEPEPVSQPVVVADVAHEPKVGKRQPKSR